MKKRFSLAAQRDWFWKFRYEWDPDRKKTTLNGTAFGPDNSCVFIFWLSKNLKNVRINICQRKVSQIYLIVTSRILSPAAAQFSICAITSELFVKVSVIGGKIIIAFRSTKRVWSTTCSSSRTVPKTVFKFGKRWTFQITVNFSWVNLNE